MQQLLALHGHHFVILSKLGLHRLQRVLRREKLRGLRLDFLCAGGDARFMPVQLRGLRFQFLRLGRDALLTACKRVFTFHEELALGGLRLLLRCEPRRFRGELALALGQRRLLRIEFHQGFVDLSAASFQFGVRLGQLLHALLTFVAASRELRLIRGKLRAFLRELLSLTFQLVDVPVQSFLDRSQGLERLVGQRVNPRRIRRGPVRRFGFVACQRNSLRHPPTDRADSTPAVRRSSTHDNTTSRSDGERPAPHGTAQAYDMGVDGFQSVADAAPVPVALFSF